MDISIKGCSPMLGYTCLLIILLLYLRLVLHSELVDSLVALRRIRSILTILQQNICSYSGEVGLGVGWGVKLMSQQ